VIKSDWEQEMRTDIMTMGNIFRAIGAFFMLSTGVVQVVNADQILTGAAFMDREVKVTSSFPNVELSGTLSVPNGKGPHPAILLITSAGGQTRDQVVSGVPMFKVLAEHLTKEGFAVLRVDDRGVGKSTGPSVWDSTTAEKAVDMQSCITFLKKQPEIDPKRIGLIGHSEGAMTTAMVASNEADLRFAVLLGLPGVTGEEIWNRQQNEAAKHRTKNESVLKALETERRKMIEFIKSGKNDDETYYRLGHDYFAAFRMPESANTRQLTDENFGFLRKKWFSYFFANNPVEHLKKLRVPTLVLLGSADEQVSVAQNLRPIVSALVEAGNTDFTSAVLPKQDHFFIAPENSADAKPQLSGTLLLVVTEWTKRRW
jgi:pimeloyl-ACP methyl ester carboxylesterase